MLVYFSTTRVSVFYKELIRRKVTEVKLVDLKINFKFFRYNKLENFSS